MLKVYCNHKNILTSSVALNLSSLLSYLVQYYLFEKYIEIQKFIAMNIWLCKILYNIIKYVLLKVLSLFLCIDQVSFESVLISSVTS